MYIYLNVTSNQQNHAWFPKLQPLLRQGSIPECLAPQQQVCSLCDHVQARPLQLDWVSYQVRKPQNTHLEGLTTHQNWLTTHSLGKAGILLDYISAKNHHLHSVGACFSNEKSTLAKPVAFGTLRDTLLTKDKLACQTLFTCS